MARPIGTTAIGLASREKIIEQAENLIEHAGFRDMTMRQLAQALGMAMSSLYHHFTSKEELVGEVHRITMEEGICRHEDRVQAGLAPLEVLRAAAFDLMETVALRPGRARVLFDRERSAESGVSKKMNDLERQYEDLLANVVRELVTSGQMRPIEPRLAVRALVGMVAHSRFWFDPDGPLTYQDVVGQLWEIYRQGTAPAP